MIDIEEVMRSENYSITNPETIRQIALIGIHHENLLKKIKPEFQFAGLYPNTMKVYNIKPDKKVLTPEDLGGLLFAIHDHHPETEEIIYYENDLIEILKLIGLPEPSWGKSITAEEYKRRQV